MPDPAIEVHALRKRFGDVVALDGLDLTVAPATVFGLLGPNGAGKTTAVRALTTTLRPDSGSASVLGVDVCADPAAVRARIGLAGQSAAVDENLTGRENLRLVAQLTHVPRRVYRPRVDQLLERFDLSEAADRPVRTYSGGMRRRLDVSAALVHQPPVLFFDEPTTGLDPASRMELWAVIEELVAAGTTVLLTTQYLEEADRLANRIAVVDHGRVIAEGTAAELKNRLGSTVIEIGLADADAATRACGVLGPFGVSCEHDDRAVYLAVEDAPHALVQALRRLDAEQLSPTAINVREPSLDDVFLTLTGHRAESDGEQDPDAVRERGAA
ncbi:MAG: ATP-binding cassette domain-containing protein [Acidimicrobiia bacterium]